MIDMMTYAAEREQERFDRSQSRIIGNQGFGASVEALGISQAYLPQLSSYIEHELLKPRSAYPDEVLQGLFSVIRQLDPKVIALATLSATLSTVAREDQYRNSCLMVGRTIYGECWARKLLQHDGKLAARIERSVRQKHGNAKYRMQAARSTAARAGFRALSWGPTLRLRAGATLVGWLLEALPEVFTLIDAGNNTYHVAITEEAEQLAMSAVEEAIRNRPYYIPSLSPPVPWTGWAKGGFPDSKRYDTVLRTHHKATAAAVKSAIRDGSAQPFLNALNAIQDVPWTINTKVLEVLRACIEQSIEVKGLPLPKPLDTPARDKPWEEMDEGAQKLWRIEAGKVKATNRGLVSERVQITEDVRTAELLSMADAFWTPCNCDWRGRVYPMPHFNFQRDDRVRALFLYRDGAPIGVEGLWWLKVHVANTGDFDKTSKRPLEERVAWVDQRLEKIHQVAGAPLENMWWSQADKPFLFLASCIELSNALASMDAGYTYVTRLPVSFDGSCSGLQHLSAMTRAPEGSLVNLTPSPEPQDVYSTVANVTLLRIQRDLDTEDADYARMCLAYGVDRKLVKRNVMTFAYSSKRFGMSQQHIEDTMKPLRFEVLAKRIAEHPFGDNEKTQEGCARYLAGHVYAAITQVVDLPAQAMGFLQKCAKALAHESKPLSWVTPTGLPWDNRYYVPNFERVSLYLQDVRVRIKMAVGDTREIDKDRVSNGVAPNFVHALDAAHLSLTAVAARREGIELATVHDSFGCLAPHATRLNAIIREEFVRMYTQHDVLAEVLASAQRDITPANSHRLPEGLQYGSLDIRQVLEARFAFA